MKTRTWAIICSNYINASNIVVSLRAIGWRGPIVCIKEGNAERVLTEVFKDGVETWAIPLQQPADLLVTLAERIPADEPKVVFFCDERFLEAFRDRAASLLPNSRFLLGSATHLDIILNRFAFYCFIEKDQLAQVPKTIAGDEDPWIAFDQGFFIRPNLTWDGLQRLPRVQLVHTREQQNQIEAHLELEGLNPQQWCYQEVLSLDPLDNVSICGWHGPEERLYFATHHLLRHPNEVGNGDVTELIPSRDALIESTQRVLTALNYEGPFELEYVLDKTSNTYKVIELNPRFWMQHGLIEALAGHALVRRYAGLETSGDSLPVREIRYWVNSFYAVFRLFKGDWRIIRYLTSNHTLMAPNWSLALRYSPSFVSQKLRQVIFK
jgi:hypothetical protein